MCVLFLDNKWCCDPFLHPESLLWVSLFISFSLRAQLPAQWEWGTVLSQTSKVDWVCPLEWVGNAMGCTFGLPWSGLACPEDTLPRGLA